MLLSKVMAEKDYDELQAEGLVIKQVHDSIHMWYEYQHRHRLWEYSLAQKALKAVYGGQKNLMVADHGCGAGYLSPILFWLGHTVRMYEPWAHGSADMNLTEFMLEQMRRVAINRPEKTGVYELFNRPLGGLTEEDRNVDAAFCISTLEHIPDYQAAFRDFLSTIKPGGLGFITTDFGEHERDDYACASLRCGKMFTEATYVELYDIAKDMGFDVVQDQEDDDALVGDWEWSEENRMVMNYGFASMALVNLSQRRIA